MLTILALCVVLSVAAPRAPVPSRLANEEAYCTRYGGRYSRMRCMGCNTCELNGKVYSQKDFAVAPEIAPPRAPRRRPAAPPAVAPRVGIDAYQMANSREYCEGRGGTYSVARCPFCNSCTGPNGNVYTQKQYPPPGAAAFGGASEQAPPSNFRPRPQVPQLNARVFVQMANYREVCEANGGQYFQARCMGCSYCVASNGKTYSQKEYPLEGVSGPRPQIEPRPAAPAVPARTGIDAKMMADSREYCESKGGQYRVARCPFCNSCVGPNGNVYNQQDYR